MSVRDQVQALLQRMWKYNANRIAALDYEMIVLAVPHFPGNAEAISALDLPLVVELLQNFIDNFAMPGKQSKLSIATERADDNGRTCLEFSRALQLIRDSSKEPEIEKIARDILAMPWLQGEKDGDAGDTGLGEGSKIGGDAADQGRQEPVPSGGGVSDGGS